MTVKEMHIRVDQYLQEISAARTRDFFPEEKDLYLNKVQDRFIQDKVIPKPDNAGGYMINEVDLDSIQSLIISGKSLIPYIDSQDRYRCILPSDYAYLLDDSSDTLLLCGATKIEVNSPVFLTIVKQVYTLKESIPYYETLILTNAGTGVGIPQDLPYRNNYSGQKSKRDIMFLTPWIAHKTGLYWEKWGDEEFDNSYIHAGNVSAAGTLTIDGTLLPNVYSTKQLSYKTHSVPGKVSKRGVVNRLTPSTLTRKLSNNSIYKTAHYSPISELSNGILYVYCDESFIITNVVINYVRKPAPISLSLGTDSELPVKFHEKLCDLAVEEMKSDLQNPQGTDLKEKQIEKRVYI